jgi:hypothetical protein
VYEAERRRVFRWAPGEEGGTPIGNSVVIIAPRRDCGGGVCRERGERGGVVGGEEMGDASVLPRLKIPERAGAELGAISALFVLLRFVIGASLLLRPFASASSTSCGSAGSCASVTGVLRMRGPRLEGSRGWR